MEKFLKSTAFPDGFNPQRRSSVHEILDNPYQVVGVKIRPFQISDMDQLVLLHQEWFPLEYGQSFYQRVSSKSVQCKIAEAIITQEGETKNIIVGILVYQYETAGSILKCQKWSEYLYWSYVSIYIMTVGVIDEFRSMGIGKRFLEVLVNECNENSNIKYIHLHMVAYNSASRFYQKSGFESIETLTNHYNNIKGKPEDARHYIKFFNGGVRRLGWIEWIKSAWGGNNQSEQIFS